MSHDDHLRRTVEEQVRNNPQTPKKTEQDAPNAHDREVINAEIERQREQQRRG